MSRGSAFVLLSILSAVSPSIASPPSWSTQFSSGFTSTPFLEGPRALGVHTTPAGPRLFIGGHFDSVAGIPAANLVAFDGSTFTPIPGAEWDTVYSFTTFPVSGVQRLLVGGLFQAPQTGDGLAWIDDNLRLQPMPPGPIPFAWFGGIFGWNSPSGPELLLSSGIFPTPGSEYLYRYTSTGYASVDEGIVSTAFSFAVYDNGTGPAVYMNMPTANFGVNSIARWDGSSLTDVVPGNINFFSTLCVHDDGTGPALYVAGNGVTRLRGSTWQTIPGAPANAIHAMASFDDGTGPALYVAGQFTSVNNQSMSNIARWRNNTWEPLSTGITGGSVEALAVFDEDGPGPRPAALYAVGKFTTAGNVPSRGIARWGRPACPPDINADAALSPQDIFDFLNAWFIASPAADFNLSGSITTQDIFDFLNAWFTGC